jgi:hypothetical protein
MNPAKTPVEAKTLTEDIQETFYNLILTEALRTNISNIEDNKHNLIHDVIEDIHRLGFKTLSGISITMQNIPTEFIALFYALESIRTQSDVEHVTSLVLRRNTFQIWLARVQGF